MENINWLTPVFWSLVWIGFCSILYHLGNFGFWVSTIPLKIEFLERDLKALREEVRSKK